MEGDEGPARRRRRRTRILAAFMGGLLVLGLGALAFSYFVTPSWVASSVLHARASSILGYKLGSMQRSLTTVSFPTTDRQGDCHGDVTLRWQGVFGGWRLSAWDVSCTLGHAATTMDR